MKFFSVCCCTSNTLDFFLNSAWEKSKAHVWHVGPLGHPSSALSSPLLGIITLKKNTPVALQLQKACAFPPLIKWRFSVLTEGFSVCCASFLKGIPLRNLEKYVGPSKVGTANGKTRCVIGNWDISAKRETPLQIPPLLPQVSWWKNKAIFAVRKKHWEVVIYEMTVYCQNKGVTLVEVGQTLRRL